jgi:putative phosphoribosyl transferase
MCATYWLMLRATEIRDMESQVEIPVRGATLSGILSTPHPLRGIVLFAHGSGSSRHSPRNRFVSTTLNRAGLGTLLFDLLTPEEESVDESTRELRFNIALLAERLGYATEWIAQDPRMRNVPVGYFGSSTGGAAALVAAAERSARISAIVSRGGRPDLADTALANVRAPTLLIIGSRDEFVIQLNREAMKRMQCEVKLELVTGATHLFSEPGTLQQVAEFAADWFVRYAAPESSMHRPVGRMVHE